MGKNDEKIRKAQAENILIKEKVKLIKKAMDGLKAVSEQLNLFDPIDYKPIEKQDEESSELQ